MSTGITPRTTTHTIYHGDDMERLGEMFAAAEAAERFEQNGVARIGDVGDAQAKKDAYYAAADEAATRATVIRLNQLGRKAFRALMTEHPPRDGNEADKGAGYNEDTFPEALLAASVVEPEFRSNAERDTFLDNLAEGDFDSLFIKAYMLNRQVSADPKLARFSSGAPMFGETSA
tara:strand:- start:1142 stop:1666 length:525 start_codon:yes stop_codon:yes gene_type:complete